MASAGRGAAKLSRVAIGTLREWALWATCRFWDPEQLQTVLFNAHSGGSLTPAETTAPQGFCHARAMQQCRKRQHLRPLRPTVSWHLATMRVHLGVPPEKGGAGLENPSMYQMYALAGRRHLSCGAGWQSVRVLWRAVRGDLRIRRSGTYRFSSPHRPPPLLVALLSVLYGALP